MSNDRREFMKLAGATAAAAGLVGAATPVVAQVVGQFKAIKR
jgi:anaerobic selenocysteine-containing dehydrogenase